MSDVLIARLRNLADCDFRADKPLGKAMREAADRIAALEAKLKFVLQKGDRTFALMLARAEKAEAERDELTNQLDSRDFSIEVLEKRVAEIMTRAEKAEAQIAELVEAGGAMIAFHNGPTEAMRPDIWQRLLQRFANALAKLEDKR